MPSAKLVILEAMRQRIEIMEGVARGERAVNEWRTMPHHQAKTRLSRWLHQLPARSDESASDTSQNATESLLPLPE